MADEKILNDENINPNVDIDNVEQIISPSEVALRGKDEKIVELETKIASLDDLLKRSQADFINYRRRVEEERLKNLKYAGESVLKELLPVIDNFKRAFTHIPKELSTNEWVKGVAQIEQQFLKLLVDLGVQKIECLGMPADYNLHEVIGQDVGPKDIILNEIEPGYMYYDKVLRVSKVIVGKD